MSTKNISRIDSGRTHGWFARVYRAEWVGSKSFADAQYGGREQAEAAASKWVRMADEQLPIIPPKPMLRKATINLRSENKLQGTLYYWDVYLPTVGDETTWSQKLFFQTLDEKEKQKAKADRIAKERNQILQKIYVDELAAWYVENDRLMDKVLSMWDEVKNPEKDGHDEIR
jgi:hypothetical protein